MELDYYFIILSDEKKSPSPERGRAFWTFCASAA